MHEARDPSSPNETAPTLPFGTAQDGQAKLVFGLAPESTQRIGLHQPAFLTGSRSEVTEVVANARLATKDGVVVSTAIRRAVRPSVTQQVQMDRPPNEKVFLTRDTRGVG
jgi:hypothetical protein